MDEKPRWPSVHRPWDVLAIVAGAIGLFVSWASLRTQDGIAAPVWAWIALGGSAAAAVAGVIAHLIRRERRNRGLVLNQGQGQGTTFAAIGALLVVAFASTVWPIAARYAWLGTVLGPAGMAGAAWLGLRLARSGLPASFRRAQRLVADGEAAEALQVLEELAGRLPDFCWADQLRAQIYRERQEYAEALEVSERLVSRCPELYYGYAEQGLTLMAQGLPEQALRWFARGIEVAPGLPEAHFNLGMAAAEAREPERTARAMSAALRLGIRDQITELISRYQLHLALESLGHQEAAARELRRLRRMRSALGEWRASLADEDLPRHRRRADMALSARIERVMHT